MTQAFRNEQRAINAVSNGNYKYCLVEKHSGIYTIIHYKNKFSK